MPLNRYIIIFVGVVVFSAGLAIVIGRALPEPYLLVGFGFATGTLVGVLIGSIGTLLILRSPAHKEMNSSVYLQLTPEQAQYLFKALERQQVSPESMVASPRGERSFKTVGGAEISPYDDPDVQ